MTLQITLHGTNEARCGDIVVSGGKGSALCNLARKLVDAGHDEMTTVRVMRGETLAFNVAPLAAFCRYTVSENDTTSARFIEYKPMPKGMFGGAA